MIIVRSQGGLGNQLFFYATALQISKKFKQPVVLDNSYFHDEHLKILFKLDKFRIYYIEEKFEKKTSNNLKSKLKRFLFSKVRLFQFAPDNVINGDLFNFFQTKVSTVKKNKNYLLEGWLQNIEYFTDVSDVLSETLWLRDDDILAENQLTSLIKNSNSVAIHIRRGDMAINPNFNTLGLDYYEKAIKEIVQSTDDPHFFIFSDEPEKAKKMLENVTGKITYLTEQSESLGYYGTKGDYIDFELMRLCKHFIIANSTFSWWPAYLAQTKGKIVVAPAFWYKNNILQSNFLKSGLLQKEWKIIEN